MATHRLINKQNVRRFLLDYAKRNRAHGFTRVADTVFDQVDAAVRETCRRIIRAQPSVGKTVK